MLKINILKVKSQIKNKHIQIACLEENALSVFKHHLINISNKLLSSFIYLSISITGHAAHRPTSRLRRHLAVQNTHLDFPARPFHPTIQPHAPLTGNYALPPRSHQPPHGWLVDQASCIAATIPIFIIGRFHVRMRCPDIGAHVGADNVLRSARQCDELYRCGSRWTSQLFAVAERRSKDAIGNAYVTVYVEMFGLNVTILNTINILL